jgi:predicted transposase/invertase (TIGR01784 family)
MTAVQLKPTDDILDMLIDPVFKAVFTRDTTESREALKSLIAAYTGNVVQSLTVKQNEPAVEGTSDRQIRFDISVKFNDGKLADIEMNMNALGFDLQRGEFYLDKLHSSQSIHGIAYDYSDLKETWQISFFNNRIFFNDDAIIHKFEYYDIDNKVSLGGLTHMVTAELDKLANLEGKSPSDLKEAEKWAYTMKYCPDQTKRDIVNKILSQEEGISMAIESLLTISRDENERARLLTQEKNLTDWQAGINYAKREGRQEIKDEAQNMLKQGMTAEQVLNRLLGK